MLWWLGTVFRKASQLVEGKGEGREPL